MAAADLTVGTSQALAGIGVWLSVPGGGAAFAFSPAAAEIAVGSVIRGGPASGPDESELRPQQPPSRWTGSAEDGAGLSFGLDFSTGQIDLKLTAADRSSREFSSIVQLLPEAIGPASSWLFLVTDADGGPYNLRLSLVPGSADRDADDGNRWLVPSWVADVRSRADSLENELRRACDVSPTLAYGADVETAWQAIKRARSYARRPVLGRDYHAASGPDGAAARQARRKRPRLWRRVADWWTGYCIDMCWAELHAASQALLMVQDSETVKAQLTDLAAAVVTELTPGDLRINRYLKALDSIAAADRDITAADRAQLREIREVCDIAGSGGRTDARSFRDTLILVGSFLTVVLVAAALVGAADSGFRALFAATPHPNPWFVLELELIASLSGLTGAVLSLQAYTGFRWTYGLPFVQALLKGSTGAATGLFGVLFVRSGVVTALKLHSNIEVFAVAVIFGYAQYLFTRLIDREANAVLKNASSRNDPAIVPQLPAGTDAPNLVNTSAVGRPRVTRVSPGEGPSAGGKVVHLSGSGFTGASEVKFGRTATATDVSIESDSHIVATSPPGNDTVDVTVTTPVDVSPVSAQAKFRYTDG